MGAVSIRQIRKTFGAVEVLKGIDIEVEAGEFLILVGPSGCGKSTLLNMIAGLETPSSGSIHMADRDVTFLPSRDRDIAMVFQSYALYPNMSVAGNIAFALEMRKVPKPQREAAVQRVAAMLQITHLLDRKPGQLSGGQRQRVAMGRALARDPSLFLFDEPLSNLDARLRRKVRDEIRDLQQRLGLTVLYVTHDQQEALAVSDKVIVMDNAVIAQEGTPEDLYRRPRSRFLADFIGESNIIEGAFGSADGETTFTAQGVTLRLGQVAAPPDARAIALRPDRVRLIASPGSPVKVRRRVYLGHAWEYTLDAPWGEVLVITHEREAPVAAGAQVSLDIEPGSGIPLSG